MKKNVLFITGTRADYGLIKPVFLTMQKSKILRPRLLVTGMHTMKKYGNTINEIIKDKIKISSVIPAKNGDMIKIFSAELSGFREYCIKNRPDLMVLLGDRGEMLAAAITALYLKIPVAHIAGGDLSGYVFDESIRHALTKLSHIHFATNTEGARRIRRMGEEKWRIFNVGAPGLESLDQGHYLVKHELARKLKIPADKSWTIILHHPTTLDRIPIKMQIAPLLKTVARTDSEKIVIYPNSDTGSSEFIHELRKYINRDRFHFYRNFERNDYLSLLKNADLLMGNSSSGIVESTFFGLPALNIGNRQKGRAKGRNVIDCGYDEKSIETAIKIAGSDSFLRSCKKAKSPYGGGNVAAKIVKILENMADKPNLLLKENFPAIDKFPK